MSRDERATRGGRAVHEERKTKHTTPAIPATTSTGPHGKRKRGETPARYTAIGKGVSQSRQGTTRQPSSSQRPASRKKRALQHTNNHQGLIATGHPTPPPPPPPVISTPARQKHPRFPPTYLYHIKQRVRRRLGGRGVHGAEPARPVVQQGRRPERRRTEEMRAEPFRRQGGVCQRFRGRTRGAPGVGGPVRGKRLARRPRGHDGALRVTSSKVPRTIEQD